MDSQITFVIIAAQNDIEILQALESVKDLGEIIIVDGGPRMDKISNAEDLILENIASEIKAKYIYNKFENAAIQYNIGILEVQTEWTFILDSDERVTPELAKWLCGELGKERDINCYSILRINHFMGQAMKHGQFRPDRNLRLFRKNCGIYETRAVHARLITNGKIGKCRYPLLHFTVNNLDDFFSRMIDYSKREISSRKHHNQSSEVKAILRQMVLKLPFQPTFRFIYSYVFRLGFLDGRLGYLLAKSAAFYEVMVLIRKEFYLED